MAINITKKIYINGINFTPYLVQPIKWGNFLDEQLDELYFTLQNVSYKSFQPMDQVEIVLTLVNPYKNSTETLHKFYFIANDNATEIPVGSGKYAHDLYCIELTKLLEMYVVDSLTFTNILNREYGTGNEPMPYTGHYIPEKYIPVQYSTPKVIGETLNIVSGWLLFTSTWETLGSALIPASITGNTKVIQNGVIIAQENYDQSFDVTILNGAGSIEYNVEYDVNISGFIEHRIANGTFSFETISNGYPSKRITCADAINRILDLAIPIYRNEKPRFILSSKDSIDFDKIYLPEISITQSTLRECLQEVGKIIHGEPRIIPYGINTYIVSYDRYGGTKKFDKRQKYIEKVNEYAIDNYCSSIDSSVQNLVNQLDYASGAVTDPRANASRSIRVDEMYTRIEDTNMKIILPYNINTLIKIECAYSENNNYVDITDCLYEKTAYFSLLSSYSRYYPGSKAYGLYYEIGANTIEGLNFKLDSAFFPSFQKYAIINILEYKTGEIINTSSVNFYPQLRFRVTYIPYFNVRVTQSKSYINNFKEPASLIYNQSENVIESRAYGQNLKGVVSRLGNLEKSITYWATSFSQIPDAGELYDDDYYISVVSCELYNIGVKITVGLTKNFNRKSAYIGVSSERRLYEVSERAAYARTTLYKEYIVIGNYTEQDNTLIGNKIIESIADTFTANNNLNKVDHVIAQGEGHNGVKLSSVELPVVSTAIGNSLVYIWGYQDNYSAGEVSVYQQLGEVSGYFQDNYRYTDYYGKMYYYHFDIRNSDNTPAGGLEEALALPGTSIIPTNSEIFSTEAYQPAIYRKDNREISQFCAEIEFVTNMQNIIIGTGLAANNPLVSVKTNDNDPARLYLLPFEINKFVERITDNLDGVPYIGAYVSPTYSGTYANVKQYTVIAGTSTVSAGTYYTTQDGVISNAETNASGQNVYTDYLFNCKTGAFKLINPVPLDSISPGRTWYSTDIDGNTGAETGNQIYWFQLNNKDATSGDIVASRIPINAIANAGSAILIEKIVENNFTTNKLKVDIITDISSLPDHLSWAFVSPQYTQTETVEDDEGNIYEQTYSEGGDVYIGSNTPLKVDALYFTAIHDPFKQYEVIATNGGTLTTISGYKYARYDEGVGRFFVDTPIKQNELSVNDIVFNVSPYGDYPEGDTLTQSTVTAISENSITVSNEIIRRKIWTSS